MGQIEACLRPGQLLELPATGQEPARHVSSMVCVAKAKTDACACPACWALPVSQFHQALSPVTHCPVPDPTRFLPPSPTRKSKKSPRGELRQNSLFVACQGVSPTCPASVLFPKACCQKVEVTSKRVGEGDHHSPLFSDQRRKRREKIFGF